MKTVQYMLFLLLPMFLHSQVETFNYPLSDKEWQFVGNEGFSVGDVWCPNLAFSPSGELWIVFPDGGDSSRVSVMRFDGTNWVYVGTQGISPSPCVLTSLKFKSTGEPVVVILDEYSYLTAMQFNGFSWDTIGNQQFSPRAWSFGFALDPFDTLYVAFMDAINYTLSAMKFDGNQWVFVGSHPFVSYAMSPSLAIDSSGTPYVGFSDQLHNWGTTVMKYNGSGWEYVGSPGFTTSNTDYNNIRFSPSNELYVASDGYGYRARVQKLANNQWVDIGTPGISAGEAGYIRIAFSTTGVPYITYEDWADGRKATVKKFEGSWVDVGQPGFSPGETECGSLAISSSEVPYVALVDYADSGKATVMMYDYPVGIVFKKEPSINLYPNPATNWIQCNITPNANPNISVLIYNSTGEIIFGGTFTEKDIILNIENFPAGIYLVMARTEKSIYTAKFLKN